MGYLEPNVLPGKDLSNLNYQFLVPQDGNRYGGFTVTNSSATEMQYSISEMHENSSLAGLTIYNVPFVQGVNFTYVPDPLVEVTSKIVLILESRSCLFSNCQVKKAAH